MVNFFIVIVILVIVGTSVFYIINEKKKGAKCVGCPHSKVCTQAKKGGCGTSIKVMNN